MEKRPFRLWPWAAASAALLLGFGWIAAGRGAGLPEADWLEVRREDLVVSIPVTGSLEAVESVRLGPPAVPDTWDFKISFMAPEGVAVQPGMPVVGFDTSQLEQRLAEKMAEADGAQKELEKRQTHLEIQRRDRELELAEAEARRRKAALKVEVPRELLSAHELETARRDLDLAEREIVYLRERLKLEAAEAAGETGGLARQRDRALARVSEMEAAIESLTVKASKAGTLVYAGGMQGEKKKVGDSDWRGQSVVEIPDLGKLRAIGEIDEADAGRVAVGQRVHFRLDAHPDLGFEGKVRQIGTTVRGKSEANPVKVVKLEIEIDRADPQRMRPGMRFVGTVELERVRQALVAPAEAVFSRPGGPVTYRRTAWGSEAVQPKVGKRNERWVEILGGLRPGDRVARRDLAALEAERGGAG
jgi:multidrug efflux pump subunit AcrA (membrane-fusion protein)